LKQQQQQQQAMAAINNASLQANAAVANAYAQNLVGQPLSAVGNGGASTVTPTTGVGSSHMNPNAQPFTPQSQNHTTITLPVQESPATMSGKRAFLAKFVPTNMCLQHPVVRTTTEAARIGHE
jgi:hypothetical protein